MKYVQHKSFQYDLICAEFVELDVIREPNDRKFIDIE